MKAEKSKEDDQLKSLVSPSASTLSVTSSTSENTQLTHVSEQPMRRTELMPLTLDPTRFQTTSPMVANWQQMYDLNMLTNYLSQMYMERQLQEMNWPAMAQQTGIVQLHPMYLGAAVNGQQPFRMNPMSASNASMLALPSVENVEESPQPAGESSQANRVQRQESLQQQNRPRANQVTFEEPSPRFVFGQPPSAVGPKPKPENADLLPNGTNDNLEADVDVEETEERAFNVLDISEDSFDDEIEDGRYSATMFKINRPAAANPN